MIRQLSDMIECRHVSRLKLLLLLGIIIGLADVHPAMATTYYTAKDCTGGSAPPNCSDANDGLTRQTAELTIAAGLAHLAAGDTLIIGNGTYTEQQFIDDVPSGSAGAPTIIQAENNQQAILMPSSPIADFAIWHFSTDIDYVTFDGLVTDATNVSGNSGYDVHDRASSNIIVKNGITRFGSTAPGGIFMHGTDHQILNNEVHGCCSTGSFGHGIYVPADNTIIDGNTVHDNGWYGIHVYEAAEGFTSDNNTIRNNHVYNNGVGAGGAAILASSGSNHLVYNNIARAQTGQGIRIRYSCTSFGVYNNTVYGNSEVSIYVFSDSSATVRNNIMDGNTTDDPTFDGTVTDSNNRCDSGCATAASPGFVNAGAANFHLIPTSAMVGAGVAVAGITTDHDGVTRPNPPSIGAYELEGAETGTGTYSFIVIDSLTDGYIGVSVRNNASSGASRSFYACTAELFFGNTWVSFFKYVAGTYTSFTSLQTPVGFNDELAIEARDDSISCRVDGTIVAAVTDTAIADGGTYGIVGAKVSTGSIALSWEAGTLDSVGARTPVESDSFTHSAADFASTDGWSQQNSAQGNIEYDGSGKALADAAGGSQYDGAVVRWVGGAGGGSGVPDIFAPTVIR